MSGHPIYSALVLVLLPWAVLHLLWRARRQPEYLRHWAERFGFFAAKPAAPVIWIHAVSVGETRAAQPVVAALRARYPDHAIVMTHMTPTGRQTSVELFGDSITRCYLPYDTPWGGRRFLQHFAPRLGVIMETELWPNLLASAAALGIPVHLVNARLSARSARRYARWPTLSAQALGHLTGICAQTAADAERLAALGGERITLTGNVKFDIEMPEPMLALGAALRARCGPRPVWLAASTREGEEPLILDAWHKVDASGTALLVIVPRHPQRFDEVAKLVAARGLALQRRSAEEAVAAGTQVLLGDSMGEMFAYYAMADVAFIGGSLLDYGSQNLIEACAVGTPVLVGPSTRNFAEAAAGATACGAALAIRDAEELVAQVSALLPDAARRRQMGEAGREFAARHRGATARTLEAITRAGR